MRQRYHLGVLFVHGIGEQAKADGLLMCAEPLLRWMQKALSTSHLHISKVRFGLSGGVDDPAHAVVSVRPAGQAEQRWLLAEGRWAGEVRQPTFFTLAGWMLTTGAWMIVSHFLRQMQSRGGVLSRVGRVLRVAMFALPLVVLNQALVLILTVLAVIPVPRLRAMLSDVLLALTGVLGDTFVFVDNKVQKAAIVSETRRRLKWLSSRCDVIVVLGHSQGAAVAYEALRAAPKQENIRLFITYGGAIAKIHEVEHLSEHSPSEFLLANLAIAATAFGLVALLRVVWRYADNEAAWAGMTWVLMALGSLAMMFYNLSDHRHALKEKIRRLPSCLPRHVRWVDVYATADPIPNGPLFNDCGRLSGAADPLRNSGVSTGDSTRLRGRSVPIVTLRSWLADHTSYWTDSSPFIPLVARQLLKTAGLNDLAGYIASNARQVRKEHAARATWLVRSRWATAAACVVAPIVLSDLLYPIGDVTLQLSAQADVIGSAWVSGLREERLWQPSIGAFAVVGVVALWNLAYTAIWRSWDAASADRLWRANTPGPLRQPNRDRQPSDPEPGWLWPRVRDAFFVACGFLPLAILTFFWWRPDLFVGPGLELRTYRLLGWAAVVFVGLLMAAAMTIGVTDRLASRTARNADRPASSWLDLAFMLVIGGICVVMITPSKTLETAKGVIAGVWGLLLVGACGLLFHARAVEKMGAFWPLGTVAPVAAAGIIAMFDRSDSAGSRILAATGAYFISVAVLAAAVLRWKGLRAVVDEVLRTDPNK